MNKQTSFDPSTFTWPCDICGRERPDAKIRVHQVDIGPPNLPPGTVMRNVKYCSDDPNCYEGARHWDEKARIRAAQIKGGK